MFPILRCEIDRRRQIERIIQNGHFLLQSFADRVHHFLLVHPDAAPAILRQVRIMAVHHVASLPMARVVPHLLRELTHQIEADPDGVGAAHSSNAMEVGLHAIGQRHVHHERDFLHVDSARRHVRADQNPRLPFLERLYSTTQDGTNLQRVIALPRVAKPRQHHGGVFVRSTRQLQPIGDPPLVLRLEIRLEVVAVQVGAAEHDDALHLVLVDQPHQQLQLRALFRLAFVLCGVRKARKHHGAMHAVGERGVLDAVELLLRGVRDVDEEIDLLDGGGNVIAAFQIHPHRIAADLIG